MSIEFAWNTQKIKMSDIKSKEREVEREGKIKNDMIDLDRIYLNYDLVQSELNLYQRAKERDDQLKSENKRVQKNRSLPTPISSRFRNQQQRKCQTNRCRITSKRDMIISLIGSEKRMS